MPITKEILTRYHVPNSLFVETGSHMGDGIQPALDVGFDHVHSIDLPYVSTNQICASRFSDNSKVTLHLGDSRACLKALLPTLACPLVFWLDAHACGTAGSYMDVPLLGELELIASHGIKTHTILIDDARLLGSKDLFIPMESLLNALAAINRSYHIELIHSSLFPFDILAATATIH